MLKGNPKQEGSNVIDCKPQRGPCPNMCNECFYNRPGAFYMDINEVKIPTTEEVQFKIVRMNAGHDSNIQRELVIKTAQRYKDVFFNTSIPNFNFPGPVVYTANAEEELPIIFVRRIPDNLMFVRLRVSDTNLDHVFQAVDAYGCRLQVPVVLTFMSYYSFNPIIAHADTCKMAMPGGNYEWKVRHINSYWCPKKEFMEVVLRRAKQIAGRMVTMCGTPDSNLCADCGNCELYYWQTVKHMKEV